MGPNERYDPRRIVRTAAMLGVAVLASRVIGFGRDAALAAVFGATRAVDAYLAGSIVPVALSATLGAAVTVAFIPLYADLRGRDRVGAERLADQAMGLFGLAALLVSALIEALAPQMIRLVAPGFGSDGPGFRTAVLVARILAPSIVPNVVLGLLVGVANVKQSFAGPVFVTTLQTVSVIVAIVLGAKVQSIVPVAIGNLIGSCLATLVQWIWTTVRGTCVGIQVDLTNPLLREMAVLLWPAIIATGVVQVGLVVDRMLASQLPAGAMAALNYALKLQGVVYGVVGSGLGTIMYPSFGQKAAAGKTQELMEELLQSLRAIAWVGLPLSVCLAVLRHPVLVILFQHGSFDAGATTMTASPLAVFCLGTVALAWTDLLTRVYCARRALWPVIGAGVLSVSVMVGVDLALVKPIGQTGLAIGAVAGWLSNSAVLLGGLRDQGGDRAVLGRLADLWRLCVASIGAGVAAALAVMVLPISPTLGSFVQAIVRVVLGGCTYLAAFTLCASLAGAPELRAAATTLAQLSKRGHVRRDQSA